MAVAAVRNAMQPSGGFVYLRLVRGASPPKLDPQGRELPEGKAGSVLVAKVGQQGHKANYAEIKAADLSGENEAYRSSALDAICNSEQGKYLTREVTAERAPFAIDDAIVILRAWGIGMRQPRYRNATDPARKQDNWLVEEVTQHMIDDERTKPAAKPMAATGKPASAAA